MARAIKYHFYLKDNGSQTPTPINFILNKGGLRIKKSIGERILPKYWDEKQEKAIISTTQTKSETSLENPRASDPLNRSSLTLCAKIWLTPCAKIILTPSKDLQQRY